MDMTTQRTRAPVGPARTDKKRSRVLSWLGGIFLWLATFLGARDNEIRALQRNLRDRDNELGRAHREWLAFGGLTVVASREMRDMTLRPLLLNLCEMLNVDRVAVGTPVLSDTGSLQSLRLISGIGPSLPSEGHELDDVDMDVARRLMVPGTASIPTPTEGVSWDVYIPIRDHDGVLLGILLLDDTADSRVFTDDEKELFRRFVVTLTEVFRAKAEKERDRIAATIDRLTGLFNRGTFMDHTRRVVAESRRQKHPVSVLFMDLDHFKAINDALGHAAADKVLERFGEMVETRRRTEDVSGRYGGEEFVLAGQGTPEELTRLAEDLRETFALFAKRGGVVKWQGNLATPPTLTIGVAQVQMPEGSPRTAEIEAAVVVALNRADAAMYAGKQAGRDQVVQWTPEMGEAPPK